METSTLNIINFRGDEATLNINPSYWNFAGFLFATNLTLWRGVAVTFQKFEKQLPAYSAFKLRYIVWRLFCWKWQKERTIGPNPEGHGGWGTEARRPGGALSRVSPISGSRIWRNILKNPTNGMPDSSDVISYLACHWSDFSGYCVSSWNLNMVKPDSHLLKRPSVSLCNVGSSANRTSAWHDHSPSGRKPMTVKRSGWGWFIRQAQFIEWSDLGENGASNAS